MRRRQRTLGWLLLGGLLSLYIIGCQLPGSTPPTPVVIVQNAQGTPLAGAGVGPTVAPATPTPAPSLVQNGTFALEWTTGWQRNTGSTMTGQNITEVIATSEGSSGKAVRLVHDGADYLAISQTIRLPSLEVSISAKLNPSAETPCRGILKSCTGQAGLMITLYGANLAPGKELGQFLYLYPGSDPNLRQTSAGNSHFVFLSQGWQTISIANLRQEIINSLPDVNPTAVQAIQILIVAGSRGSCDPGKCYAEVQATDIQIAAKW